MSKIIDKNAEKALKEIKNSLDPQIEKKEFFLSAVIPLSNNKKDLETINQTIESLPEICEVIIVHNRQGKNSNGYHSEQKHGNKLIKEYFFNEPILNMSNIRNYGIAQASGRYVLNIDADEILLYEISYFDKLLNENLDEKTAIFCNVWSYVSDGTPNRIESIPQIRLFTNKIENPYQLRIHEQSVYNLKNENFKIINSPIMIKHNGYQVPLKDLRKKFIRNLLGNTLDLKENFNNSAKRKYILDYIGRSVNALNELEEKKWRG